MSKGSEAVDPDVGSVWRWAQHSDLAQTDGRSGWRCKNYWHRALNRR